MRKFLYKSIIFISRKLGLWVFVVYAWIVASGFFLLFPLRVANSVKFYRALYPDRNWLFHLWCSWLYDEATPINRFKLSIFSDDPVGPGGSDPDNQFSKPDEELWYQEFGPGDFNESIYTEVQPGEWWWDVLQGELIENADTQIWQYDIYIDPETAFRQTGSSTNPKVYWLVVRIETFGGQVGWKTRRWPAHYNDDAVFDAGTEFPRIWRELRYPPGHPYHGYEENSIDMAFVITTQPETEPAMDLGDAPDSSNNHGSTMDAYPGVQANFPTVFNDGTGAGPYGPLHKLPETVAFLGEDVTLELEADIIGIRRATIEVKGKSVERVSRIKVREFALKARDQ